MNPIGSAAVAPVKYECDSNNLKGSFARSKILLTDKLTNRALVTPTTGQQINGLVQDSSALAMELL